jgi:hypothetical protein
MKTIGVDLWADQMRGAGGNHPTCFGRVAMPIQARSVRDLFLAAYPRFADTCREVDEPGLAVVAVDELSGRAAGVVRMRARVGRQVASIVGRHDRCDLFLTASSHLALRHLAVVLAPVASWTTVSYRVFDLRTYDGFSDEHGRPLRGVRCEGPAVLRCHGHVLFALPLGDPTDWPASPHDAWACLPERVYFDELEHVPQGSIPRRLDKHSHITATHGPWDSGSRLVSAGELVGSLELHTPTGYRELAIGRDALRDGVLLGRYARCDNGGLADDASMSRVHALLVRLGDDLVLVDAASTNGTARSGATKERLIQIEDDSELRLGLGTTARWRWLA